MTKEYVLSQLPTLYRADPWVEELFRAAGLSADAVAEAILALYHANWFDVMPADEVTAMEKQMGIRDTAGQSLDDRRATVQARWKSDGKSDIDLLQAVADSWQNGEVNVAFETGEIRLTFRSLYGVPADLQTLLDAIGEARPAHLPVSYVLRYLLLSDVSAMTLAELETQTLNKFAGGA